MDKPQAPQSPFHVEYDVNAFDGGLNSKYEPQLINDVESPDCKNVVFTSLGSVQTRDGIKKLNTTPVATAAADGLFATRFNNGATTMVGFWNGSAYQLAVTTFSTVPSAQSVFTAGSRVDMAMYQNLAFFGTGGQPYKYNGTEWTRHGIEVPSAPAAATGAAGILSGAYQYKVSYMNSYVVEGDVGSACATLNVTGGVTVSVTGIPVAPTSFGVSKRKLYRTAASATTFQLLTTLSDNTTTTYSDNTADSALGAFAPTDQGKPPNWKYVKAFQERLWMVDPSTPQILYYTELGNPFVRKASDFIQISDGDGEVITGLNIHMNNIAIYKEASVWLIYLTDTTPSNWLRIKTNSKYGATGHFAIVDYSSLQMFLGKRYDNITGFYDLTGIDIKPDINNLQLTSVGADSHSDKIEPDVFTFNKAAISNASAIEFKNKLWFAVPTGSSVTNNRVYQFDFQRRDIDRTKGSWVPFTGWNPACWAIYSGSLYFASALADGFVYLVNASQYSDDGTAIDSYYWTREYDGYPEDSDYQKDFRFGNFIVENLGNWYMNITYKLDSDKGSGTAQQVSVNPGGSQWGSMVWGRDSWGGGVTRQTAKVFFSGNGKRIQFKFDNQNTAGQAFKVARAKFYYNRRGLR